MSAELALWVLILAGVLAGMVLGGSAVVFLYSRELEAMRAELDELDAAESRPATRDGE